MHVFAFLKLVEGSSPPSPADMIVIQEAIKYLNITEMKVDDRVPQYIQPNPNCVFPDMWLGDPDNIQKFLHQYESVEGCYKIVLEYEKKNNMTFDVLLRIRTDLTWLSSVPPWCAYDPTKIYGKNGFKDFFNIVSRQNSPAVFGMLSWYKNECNTTFSPETRKRYNPEALLSRRAREVSGQNLFEYDFGTFLVRRQDTGPVYRSDQIPFGYSLGVDEILAANPERWE
ncbi:hypothetical protein HDU83_008717 [Entophlyctis luteolus]|nr:hypothetical protein HDU83_008717 [Entophlyctis luteolus]